MNSKIHTSPHDTERVWFFCALAALVIAVMCYMYFVSASVVHVVMRKEIDREIAEKSSEISALEAHFIEAQHSVSKDIATLHGFEVATEKIFIDKTESTLSLKDE